MTPPEPPEGDLRSANAEAAFTREAMRCCNPVQAGETHLWGDLAIGKRADIAMLDSDIHALEPMQVRRAKVVGTWLGGVRVHG